MRPAIKGEACLLGICGLLVVWFAGPAQAAPAVDDSPQCVALLKSAVVASPTPAKQAHVDARTDAAFFFSLTEDGGFRMLVKAGQLEVDKTVYPGGRSRIVLQADSDRVSVTVGAGVVEVERRIAGRMRLDVAGATEAEWLQVRVLLAGSNALRLFRALASSLDASTLKTPGGAAVVLSDAVLGSLDGDVGAVGRFMQRVRAAVQARIRPVRFATSEEDCWHNYEQETLHAMDDYDSCRNMFRWYDPRQAACLGVWTVQAEAAWAELISCSGLHLAVS